MRAVAKYKLEKKIVDAYTLKGLAYIKIQNDNSPVAINTMDALINIISNLFRDC